MERKVSNLERLFLDDRILAEYFEDLKEAREDSETLEFQIRKRWDEIGVAKHEPN